MKSYDRGFRDGLKEGEELAYHVAVYGHAVIDGIFAVSCERYMAACEFTIMYRRLREEWQRDPSADVRVRTRRLRYLQAVTRDLWRLAA